MGAGVTFLLIFPHFSLWARPSKLESRAFPFVYRRLTTRYETEMSHRQQTAPMILINWALFASREPIEQRSNLNIPSMGRLRRYVLRYKFHVAIINGWCLGKEVTCEWLILPLLSIEFFKHIFVFITQNENCISISLMRRFMWRFLYF